VTSIYFFPWLDVPKTIDFGSVLLEPYRRGRLPGNQEYITQSSIDKVMDFYKDSPVESVSSCAMLRLKDYKIGQDITESEKEFLRIFAELLCFSHIAERSYFCSDIHYCCKEDFALHSQWWNSAEFDGFITVPSRRRDGYKLNLTDAEYDAYHCPHNANKSSNLLEIPSLIIPLLNAYKAMNAKQLGNVYECIINYNLANTDNALISTEAELVLLHSAFDAIFRDVDNNSIKREEFFKSHIKCSLKTVSNFETDSCLANSIIQKDNNKQLSLIYHWLEDFKSMRGHCAHGGTIRNYKGLWSQRNHLVLGSFVLPLLLKKQLEIAGFYNWSHEDQANLESFEKLIQYDHFNQKWFEDIRRSSDHPWNRIRKLSMREANRSETKDVISQILSNGELQPK
jgi:hypothetical protein